MQFFNTAFWMYQALEVPLLDFLLMDKEIVVQHVILNDNPSCDYHKRIGIRTPSRLVRREKPWAAC